VGQANHSFEVTRIPPRDSARSRNRCKPQPLRRASAMPNRFRGSSVHHHGAPAPAEVEPLNTVSSGITASVAMSKSL
jgi:hypothetical protein